MAYLNIIVTIKQVPDTRDVKINPETNTLIRDGLPSIINPEDLNALEAALVLKETVGGTVTVLSMGPPQAEEALEEALAMGADKAVLITDRAFAGSDTLITAFILSRAIMKLKKYDLIICGRQAIDGDTAQVGPQISNFLALPLVTYAEGMEMQGSELIVKRSLEEHFEWVKVKLPALVTVTSEINLPRHPSLLNVDLACNGCIITRWGFEDLNLPTAMLGHKGSPTSVRKIFEPDRNRKGVVIKGDEREAAHLLLDKLKDMNVL